MRHHHAGAGTRTLGDQVNRADDRLRSYANRQCRFSYSTFAADAALAQKCPVRVSIALSKSG